jgi:hypothetical protein
VVLRVDALALLQQLLDLYGAEYGTLESATPAAR